MANEELKAKAYEWANTLSHHDIRAITMDLQKYNSDKTSEGLTVTPEIRQAMEAVCHHAGNGWTPVMVRLGMLQGELEDGRDATAQYANVVKVLDGFADVMRAPIANLEEVMPQFSGVELEKNKHALTGLKAVAAEAREAAKELKKTPPVAKVEL